MLRIRFFRTGKKNQPFFKIVVTEKTRPPHGGRFVEEVGFYNPLTKEKNVNKDRIKYWISVGAKPSDTVYNLLVMEGIIEGKKIAKHKKKKENKKGESVPAASAPAASAPAVASKEEKPAEKPKEEDKPAEVSKEPADKSAEASPTQTEKPPKAEKPPQAEKPTEKPKEEPKKEPKEELKPEEKPAEKLDN